MKPEVFLCLLLSCCFLHDVDCKSPIPRCLCPPHLQFGCPKNGYLLLGESVYIDFATQKCTCISHDKIQCASTCPEIPPTCKYIGRPMDGCGVCACPIDKYNHVEAGGKIEKKCEICICPPDGGKLKCRATCKA